MLMMMRIDWIRKPAWYACAYLLCRAVVILVASGIYARLRGMPSSRISIWPLLPVGSLAVPFLGFIGNHEKRFASHTSRSVCCNIPTVRFPARTPYLSSRFNDRCQHDVRTPMAISFASTHTCGPPVIRFCVHEPLFFLPSECMIRVSLGGKKSDSCCSCL